jgi:putative transcriptional regulator
MVQVLQNKKLATSFQILVEIASHQPNIQQKLIAPRIGVTPQAVSEYIAGLARDELVESLGRSRYRVTRRGINWILEMSGELEAYCAEINKAVTRFSVSVAVAAEDLAAGQEAGLFMKDGCLYASSNLSAGANGITIAAARKGEDVGISDFSGIVDLEPGAVTIGKVPGIGNGGSSRVNINRLQKETGGVSLIAAIGLEALSALRRADIEPGCRYGAAAAVIEASRSGQTVLAVCVEDRATQLAQQLEKEGISYRIIDFTAAGRKTGRKL